MDVQKQSSGERDRGLLNGLDMRINPIHTHYVCMGLILIN